MFRTLNAWILVIVLMQRWFVSSMTLPQKKVKKSSGMMNRSTLLKTLSSIGTSATAMGIGFTIPTISGAAEIQVDGGFDSSSYSMLPDKIIPGNLSSRRRDPVIIGEEGNVWKPPPIFTKLGKSRLLVSELAPLSASLIPFASDNELYYDSFLFGSWSVTANLKRKVYPFGPQYLPSKSLLEGSPRNRIEQPGNIVSYETHFFSTIANTASNRATKELGLGVPKTEIIADRGFNAVNMSSAYKQLAPVRELRWNPTKDPTRYTVLFDAGLLTKDMRPLGERKGEVSITARRSETGSDTDSGDPVFCSAERSRSVMLSPGNVVISDTETVTEYRVVSKDGNHVKAISRIAVYLTPNPNSREGVLWQETGGKAVAFFDYEMDMKRKLEEVQPGDFRSCVLTPKDVIQCY